MALQIEHEQTTSPGENEGDDSDMVFEDWLKSRKMSDETISILIKKEVNPIVPRPFWHLHPSV